MRRRFSCDLFLMFLLPCSCTVTQNLVPQNCLQQKSVSFVTRSHYQDVMETAWALKMKTLFTLGNCLHWFQDKMKLLKYLLRGHPVPHIMSLLLIIWKKNMHLILMKSEERFQSMPSRHMLGTLESLCLSSHSIWPWTHRHTGTWHLPYHFSPSSQVLQDSPLSFLPLSPHILFPRKDPASPALLDILA